MATTQWTAIRRGLLVRRPSHAPPWRTRQPRHGSILAPVVASVVVGVAATAALSRALALALAERDRRAQQARLRRERQFALLVREPALIGLRRIFIGQLDLTIELLAGDNGAMPAAEAVHETRKALKRMRTLVRLLEDELGEKAAQREQVLLREAGRKLAGARDSEVLVATLEQLMREHPRRLEHRPGVARLHARLLAERERATAQLLGDQLTRSEVLSDLRELRARVQQWQPQPKQGLRGLERPFRRLYAKGRRRCARAAGARGDRAAAMHRWRKSVKDLRYAAEALSVQPEHSGPMAAFGAASGLRPVVSRTKRRERKDRVARLARRADRLGELLGEEHDLFVLAQRVREQGCGRRTRRSLLKIINSRRKRLRRRALRDGERLYRRRPGRALRRVRREFARRASA
jgi:CHAD domain-containing protein